MTLVVGVDVGFGRTGKAKGLCRTRDVRFLVSRATSDEREVDEPSILPKRCDVLAVDGPVVAPGYLANEPRGVERMFSVGDFQKRCKPGASHTKGKAGELRRTTTDCLRELTTNVATSRELLRFPHVVPGAAIVETFPNAFLGVMVDDKAYKKRATGGRTGGFPWLLDRCRRDGKFGALRQRIEWPDEGLWDSIDSTRNREEQAALIATLTAACVVRRRNVAVGDLRGGYFFLPPWDLWADWAKAALADNRTRSAPAKIEVWINGVPTIPQSPLPA